MSCNRADMLIAQPLGKGAERSTDENFYTEKTESNRDSCFRAGYRGQDRSEKYEKPFQGSSLCCISSGGRQQQQRGSGDP